MKAILEYSNAYIPEKLLKQARRCFEHLHEDGLEALLCDFDTDMNCGRFEIYSESMIPHELDDSVLILMSPFIRGSMLWREAWDETTTLVIPAFQRWVFDGKKLLIHEGRVEYTHTKSHHVLTEWQYVRQ